mgnify:FL=1
MKMRLYKFLAIAGLFTFFATSCGFAKAEKKDKDETTEIKDVRKVKDFHSIEIESVGDVYFTQGKNYSCEIEGEAKYVKNTIISVESQKLKIKFEKKMKNVKKGITIRITAPDLKNVSFGGVGSFVCDKRLEADDIEFNVSGVGKMEIKDLHCKKATLTLGGVGKADINVFADKLKANVEGIGSVTLSGKVKDADLSRDGIGNIDKSGLKIGD